MKKCIFFVWVLCLFWTSAKAQNNVGIGTTSPSASAALDVQSTTQGMRKFPSTSDVKPNTSVSPHSNNGANPSTSFWKLSSYQSNIFHGAEFKVGNIKNTGGLGKFQ